MPKVETSLILTRGKCSLQLSCSKYVSNLIGNDTKTNFAMSRRKREAPPQNRRVVKKLVRVQPVRRNFQSVDVAQNVEASEKAVKRVRPRKRLLIKKKKRKLLTPSSSTSRRRTVVITRKRLITQSSDVLKTDEVTSVTPIEATSIVETTTPSVEDDTETVTPNEENLIPITFETSTSNEEEVLTTPTEDYEDEAPTTPPIIPETEETISEQDEISPTTKSPLTDNILEDEETTTEIYQNVPDYEPSFPELSLDAPIQVLKTTVLSSIELQTKTVVQSRLRTYTFLITRVNGDEQIVTSTTEVKPHTKTIVVTEPFTRYTTLTLLNLDPTDTQPLLPITDNPVDPSSQRNSEIRGESRSCCKFL